jgi:hypothetical protein
MEGDPTGGMWIYLIFFIIPLARILPRLLRKYRHKNAGSEPDEQYSKKGSFIDKLLPERPKYREVPSEPPKYREEEPPEPEPNKEDGWIGKDDFK